MRISLVTLTENKSQAVDSLKVLLEQGNPYPESVANTERFRCTIGLLLLTGIILSNIYKNRNVYNMIAPRAPLDYKHFEELTRDNVIIYTRVDKVVINARFNFNQTEEYSNGSIGHLKYRGVVTGVASDNSSGSCIELSLPITAVGEINKIVDVF